MRIAWYQPTDVFNGKQLIHLCYEDGKATFCGIILNQRWILWEWKNEIITCKKCISNQ